MVKRPKSLPPHVVLLGAGASRAAFPNGDKESRSIPLMDDLVDFLDLSPVLEAVGPIENANFESVYSKLAADPRYECERREVERRVTDYFSSLRLPKEPTIYDKLLLSLGPEDAVFSFNWDPFLFDSHARNVNKSLGSSRNIFPSWQRADRGLSETPREVGIKATTVSGLRCSVRRCASPVPCREERILVGPLYRECMEKRTMVLQGGVCAYDIRVQRPRFGSGRRGLAEERMDGKKSSRTRAGGGRGRRTHSQSSQTLGQVHSDPSP